MPPEFNHIIEALEKNPHLVEKNDLISHGNLSIVSSSPRSPFTKKGRTPIIADAPSYKSMNYSTIKVQPITESIFSINQKDKFQRDINEEPYNDITI